MVGQIIDRLSAEPVALHGDAVGHAGQRGGEPTVRMSCSCVHTSCGHHPVRAVSANSQTTAFKPAPPLMAVA
nr:MAG TPA: hypothetical protein [Caudoviricetes sp.]